MRDFVKSGVASLAPSGSPIYMDFPQAIRFVIDGARITKREWDDREYWGYLNKGHGLLMLRKPDGQSYAWTISEGDLIGDDWYVLV